MNTDLLAQAVEASSSFNWSQFFGTSGPLAGAALLFGYLAKIWIDSRKEKREDRKADLEGEVGAVAAARDAVALVREQMQQMKQDIAELRALREEDRKTIDKLNDRVRELEGENAYLKGHRGASG
jgi:septal ring factor EnvC (AmiA/AmiB activator)